MKALEASRAMEKLGRKASFSFASGSDQGDIKWDEEDDADDTQSVPNWSSKARSFIAKKSEVQETTRTARQSWELSVKVRLALCFE